jgi:hypothetical protein
MFFADEKWRYREIPQKWLESQKAPRANAHRCIIYGWWFSHPLKNDGVRQLGLLFPINGKVKNVPNYQPDFLTGLFGATHSQDRAHVMHMSCDLSPAAAKATPATHAPCQTCASFQGG